jgi:putative ABC transport system substrate-binding protein
MNARRRLLVVLALAALPARSQARPKRVVLFYGQSAENARETRRLFAQHLASEGFAEGRDVEVEMVTVLDWADREKLADRVIELAPDMIGTSGTDLTRLMQARTRTIPIVFRNVGDPVAAGIVASFARPGGNATGESNQSFSLEGKRLELLRELRPGLKRVTMVMPEGPAAELARVEQRRHAQALGLALDEFIVSSARGDEDLARLPAHLASGHVEAVVIQTFNPAHPRMPELLDTLRKRAIPTIFLDPKIVRSGALASLAVRDDPAAAVRMMARILRGESPATIPVVLAARTHLALNLRTARAMKLAIPESVRLRVDELIE